MPVLALHGAHQGILQDENGIYRNLLDPTVRSERPPNSSNFCCFVAAKITILGPSPHRETCTQARATKIIDGFYQFFE